MLKFVGAVVCTVAPVCAQYGAAASGYAAPSHYGYGAQPAPAPYGAYPNQYHDGYANQYHGGYHRAPRFPAAAPVIDPHYYQEVLTGFSQCVTHECSKLPKAYSESAADSIATLGGYTACVTSCAASQMMRVTADLKALIGKLIDIGSAQLAASHRYLAGRGDYAVLENNTHIQHSCCLPNDYFVDWGDLVFENRVKFPGQSWFPLFVSVRDYLEYCTQDSDDLHVGKLIIDCHKRWVVYLSDLQLNVAHLILAPKCRQIAPADACTKKLDHNPQSEDFGEDMCVAYECIAHGKRQSLESPLLKYPTPAVNYHDSCEDDDDLAGTIIKYRRVPRHAVKYYTLTTGLPSKYEETDSVDDYGYPKSPCTYDQGLSRVVNGKFTKVQNNKRPNNDAKAAVHDCPTRGRFEYCNMKQYVHWLQEQLFDLSACPIHYKGRRGDDDDDQNGSADDNTPYGYYTLGCLYRVVSLKCDCMEAVLNCYDREYKFSTGVGKTLGKAASVLCGFILCQKPKVYSLLGGQQAIENANIMKQILMQVGAIATPDNALPPVTFAFLSFGLGMVSFVAIKAAVQKMKVSAVGVEDGYRNLI